MTAQLELFNGPRARVDDPPTSVAAAASLPPCGALESLILDTFARWGAMTDEEACARLPEIYGPTLRTCRSRLAKRGLLVPTGELRASSRGRDMRVWGRP